MLDSFLPNAIVEGMQANPVFVYILVASVLIYFGVEVFLFLVRGLARNATAYKKFRSEIVWFLVPLVFIFSLLYMV